MSDAVPGAAGTARRRRVAIFGTFDVANYGDCLFPLLARAHLGADVDVVAVSPTDGTPPWRDAAIPLAIGRFGHASADAILIGGGNIVHTFDFPVPEYAGLGGMAYPSLWLGATVLAAINDLPVAWNAPGVLAGGLACAAIADAVDAAHYFSVRDEASAAIIAEATGKRPVVVPDTALDLPHIWSRDRLEIMAGRLAGRAGIAPDRLLAVSVKKRSLGGVTVAEFAAGLHAVARSTGLVPALVPLGPCHGDDALARDISAALPEPNLCLDAADTLEEIASLIACARVAVGASLHGYATAAAYGTPAVLVAAPPLAKFRGLADQLGRAHDVVADWPTALELLPARLADAPDAAIPPGVAAKLAAHWAALRGVSEGSGGRPTRLLATLTRAMAETGGMESILAPALARQR